MGENDVVMDGVNKNSSMKKIIIGIVAVVAVILAVVGIVCLVKPSPEKTVKQFLKNVESKKASKIIDSMDMIGMYAFMDCDGNYEDFVDSYKDLKEEADDNEDEYEEALDDAKESLEEMLEDIDKIKIDVKKIKSAKKVKDAKNLFKVNAKVKVEYKEDDDTERDTSTYDFYVYKKDGKYYIVGLETKSGDGLLKNILF